MERILDLQSPLNQRFKELIEDKTINFSHYLENFELLFDYSKLPDDVVLYSHSSLTRPTTGRFMPDTGYTHSSGNK